MQDENIIDGGEDQPNECPICYQKIDEKDLCKLPCNHCYHDSCLRQNFNSTGRHRNCPYCRSPYPVQSTIMKKGNIYVGDVVSFIYKYKSKTIQSEGRITRIMPNTVQIITNDGIRRRVDRSDISKIDDLNTIKG